MTPWGNAARTPKLVAGVSALALVGATGTALMLLGSSEPGASREDEFSLANADRVLQGVHLELGPDGSISSARGSVVGTTTDDEEFDFDESYAAATAADGLPVRVQTAYRTSKRSGTDLADLAGYDGPVEIQLTVQNLTAKPRPVSYDVDGRAVRRTAMVGVPLSVVASTSLGDLAPLAVRRTAEDGFAATNGVLSRDTEGTTQVQWATLLAPPQMKSATTLTLALDAKDFEVPAFDLSVEPGLVSDSSVGALLDEAFNPSDSSQMDLERRTIDVIGDVNAVLARAGRTIDRVTATLDGSAKTLGAKTVTDLRDSSTSISTSIRGLDASVTTLGRDLSSSLETTRSTTLSELQQMVQTVDAMLGDTSAKPPTLSLRGSGCGVTVPDPQQAGSVYGSLLQVAAQLDGYSRATGACRDALRASILTTIGPAQPDAEACKSDESVTCALLAAQQGFATIAADLRKDGEQAVAELDPAATDKAVEDAEALSAVVDAVDAATSALGQTGPFKGLDTRDLEDALDAVGASLDGIASAVADAHTRAAAGRDREAALAQLTTDLGARVCQMLDSGQIDLATATELRSYVAGTTCPVGGVDAPTGKAPGGRDPIATQLATQQQSWSELVALTDTANTASGIGKELAQTRAAVAAAQAALTALDSSSETDKDDLRTKFSNLTDAVKAMKSGRDDVLTSVLAVQSQQAGLAEQITKAFEDAADKSEEGTTDAVGEQIRRISDRAETDSDELAAMFDRSASGLSNASSQITRDGAAAIKGQRGQFDAQQAAAGREISASVEAGLAQIVSGITASTRDLDAANTLLVQDLRNVLLDLGTRRVQGSGLLGAMTTGAATASSAGYQLSLASRTATSYANLRESDIDEMLLRQAQTDESLRLQESLPPYRLELPDSARHRTVYTFHLQGGE